MYPRLEYMKYLFSCFYFHRNVKHFSSKNCFLTSSRFQSKILRISSRTFGFNTSFLVTDDLESKHMSLFPAGQSISKVSNKNSRLMHWLYCTRPEEQSDFFCFANLKWYSSNVFHLNLSFWNTYFFVNFLLCWYIAPPSAK